MKKGTILTIFAAILFISALIILYGIKQELKPIDIVQEQINLDSIKVYTTHITDSLTTINVEYKAKIEAKNEVIRTLKGLVNDNNKKYKVITDSALVVELEIERLKGIR